MRKTAIGGVVVAALMGVALGLASPAAAATLVNNGDGSVTVSGVTGNDVFICASSVSASACSNIQSATDPLLLYVINANGTYSEGSTVIRFPTPVPLPAGIYTMVPFTNGTAGTALLNVVIGGGGGSSSGSDSSAPTPVVQQFGLPATGTCDVTASDDLNWSGVPRGGWGISWAQWMNGGNGGAVCTRTLNYSTVQSKWVVN